jgi:iron(II)-dependent oxidoreductase
LTPVGFYDGRLHPSPAFQTTDSPSPFGAYDMAGNVREWVRDWFSPNYYASAPSSNPTGPFSGSYRAFRGGAWDEGSVFLLCAFRNAAIPTERRSDLGFRCARTGP